MSALTQINKVVSSGFLYLRQIKSISRCLPADAAKSLVNAFVVSRLDYSNSICTNLPSCHQPTEPYRKILTKRGVYLRIRNNWLIVHLSRYLDQLDSNGWHPSIVEDKFLKILKILKVPLRPAIQ